MLVIMFLPWCTCHKTWNIDVSTRAYLIYTDKIVKWVSQDLFSKKLSRIYQGLSTVLLNILPSEYFGVLMSTRLDTSVENPGAKHDCAMKPSFSSLRQTAWSSRLQSHPGMFSNKPLLWYCISWRMTLVSSQ